jgi:hypothetical protein
MVAILAGNGLLGIPGALLPVPATASLSVILDEIQRERLVYLDASPRQMGLTDQYRPTLIWPEMIESASVCHFTR